MNPYHAKLMHLSFQPLEVVSRYRDPQPQVVENFSYLFNFRLNIYESTFLKQFFYSQWQWFKRLNKWIKANILIDGSF